MISDCAARRLITSGYSVTAISCLIPAIGSMMSHSACGLLFLGFCAYMCLLRLHVSFLFISCYYSGKCESGKLEPNRPPETYWSPEKLQSQAAQQPSKPQALREECSALTPSALKASYKHGKYLLFADHLSYLMTCGPKASIVSNRAVKPNNVKCKEV